MKKLLFFLFAAFSLCLGINAQTPAANQSASPQTAAAKPKRAPVFKANKEQITQVQKMLKVSETGKLSKEDREVVNARYTTS